MKISLETLAVIDLLSLTSVIIAIVILCVKLVVDSIKENDDNEI